MDVAALMDVTKILDELEAREIRVRVEGEGLALEGPRGALPPELAEEIRRRKPELVDVLSLRGWPEASREWVGRFHRPEARLFPFLGRPVLTPRGRGRLLAVFQDRAMVDRGGRRFVFLPSEIRPPGVANQAEVPFEAVH
jgi:hypothetical protein